MSAQARGWGRRLPPKDGLIGRSEAARILECDRQKVRRLERKGLLIPALIEADGVTWFDQRSVLALAAHLKNEREILLRSTLESSRTKKASSAEAYYPELGGRHVTIAAVSAKTPAKAPAKAPSVVKEVDEVDPAWFDDDFKPED